MEELRRKLPNEKMKEEDGGGLSSVVAGRRRNCWMVGEWQTSRSVEVASETRRKESDATSWTRNEEKRSRTSCYRGTWGCSTILVNFRGGKKSF